MNPIFAFALGGPEVMMVFVVALLLFGAKKLPELARGMGKSMGEFKKARDEFEREITQAQREAEFEAEKKKAEAKAANEAPKQIEKV